jgi:hypothetical protein
MESITERDDEANSERCRVKFKELTEGEKDSKREKE